MKNNILTMTLTLVIIAVVVSVAMSYVNGITSPLIEANNAKKLNDSLAMVIDADEFPVLEENESYTIYKAVKGGEEVGFCGKTLRGPFSDRPFRKNDGNAYHCPKGQSGTVCCVYFCRRLSDGRW